MRSPERPKRSSFPSTALYLFAAFSLILPWFGVALILLGALHLWGPGVDPAIAGSAPSNATGWLLIICGIACIIFDILIDVVWAHPALSLTDEPTLNRPASGLIGRSAIVTEPIIDGRGKVRIGDTVWIAEGPDTPVDTRMRVTGTSGIALVVDRE